MEQELELVKQCLLKSGPFRSYDELLLLKSHIGKSEFIKNVLSASMLPKQVDELCRSLQLEHFETGDYVFRQNEPGDKMYIVLQGSCEVRLRQKVELAHGLSESRDKVLFVCQPGAHFGERALSEDQPRAASIVCVEPTDCITISKRVYNLLLKSAHADSSSAGGMTDQPGTKPFVLKVLSKRRETRSPLEIESVAGYLNWRVPFFQAFTLQQQLELCRVAEVITIWGKSVLFKQGSVGQAFYVILTGSVDVWVLRADQAKDLQQQRAHGGSLDVDAALGDKVSTIATGGTFGERALESEDSMRMASIVTCDQQTELLVISREDYQRNVAALKSEQTMSRIACLRRTAIFRSCDLVVLKELARYMEPRRYELDEVLFHEGSRATQMIVTEVGECCVEVPIETYTDATETTVSGVTITGGGKRRRRRVVEVGRLAPYSVLAPYVTQLQQLHDEVLHPETVRASTLVTAFTIEAHDYYTHLSKAARAAVTALVAGYEGHVLPGLWDDAPRVLGEREYRMGLAWGTYKTALLAKKSSVSYPESLRALGGLHLTADSGNDRRGPGGRLLSRTASASSVVLTGASIALPLQEDAPPLVDRDWGLPQNKQGRNYLDGLSYDLSRSAPEVLLAISEGTRQARAHAATLLARQEEARRVAVAPADPHADALPPFLKLGFSLVHLHRETLACDPANMGARRLLRAHMRLCGTMRSCTGAKAAAEEMLRAAFHTLFHSDQARRPELALKWRSFAGLEAMPLQHTDLLLVVCRSVPVEYACISPSEDLLLSFPFPASCRQRHQCFGLVSMRSLLAPGPAARASKTPAETPKARTRARRHADGEDGGSEDDDGDLLTAEGERALEQQTQPSSSLARQQQMQAQLRQPMYLRELGAIVEVLATGATRVACVRVHRDAEKLREAREQAAASWSSAASAPALSPSRSSGALPTFLAATLQSEGAGALGPFGRASQGYTSDQAPGAASRPSERPLRTCVVPLYEWLHISEERMAEMDVERIALSQAEAAVLGAAQAARGSDGPASSAPLASQLLSSFAEMGLRHETLSKAVPAPHPLPLSPRVVREVEVGAARRELGRAVGRQLEEQERARREREREAERERKERRKRKKPALPGATRDLAEGSIGGESVSTRSLAPLSLVGSIASGSRAAAPAPAGMAAGGSVLSGEEVAEGGAQDGMQSFVLSEEGSAARRACLEARAALFQRNDKLCSEERDISLLARAQRMGLSTRDLHGRDGDEDSGPEEEEVDEGGAGGARGGRQATQEEEEARRKRQAARRGLYESRASGAAGMGLLQQRMEVYQTLVSLPFRGDVEASLRKEKGAKAAADRAEARAAAAARVAAQQEAAQEALWRKGGDPALDLRGPEAIKRLERKIDAVGLMVTAAAHK